MMIEQDEMLRLSTKTKINDQVDRNHHQSERDTEKKKKKKRKKKEKRGKR
jgi:ABC-type dipeptide/oligopeptide/nickel transport system ATPase component